MVLMLIDFYMISKVQESKKLNTTEKKMQEKDCLRNAKFIAQSKFSLSNQAVITINTGIN